METYLDLVEYFESFTTLIPQIKYVVVGDDEALLNTQLSAIKYPLMWVETPDVAFTGGEDNPQTQFRFALVFATNEPKKTNAEGNKRLSEMLTLAEKAYARIYNDSEENEFDLILKNNDAAAIRRWSGDNVYGWRLEVTLALHRCECEDCD